MGKDYNYTRSLNNKWCVYRDANKTHLIGVIKKTKQNFFEIQTSGGLFTHYDVATTFKEALDILKGYDNENK